MRESQPLVFAIKGNALDDGPGIRSVIFFKGCPLSCLWCHNPESKRREVEIGFEAGDCAGCDTCLALCPQAALKRDNPFFIDRARCDLCFHCVQSCPSGALRQVGTAMSVEEIATLVLRDKPFFDHSGGGVTLSGGEPTLFMGFAGALARLLQSAGIQVLLETCGLFALQAFDQQLYPWVNLIYYDIKLIDAETHTRYCGVPNPTILENFRQLSRRAGDGGIPLLPRIPLIPGITDSEQNLHASVEFLQQCGAQQVQLLPYHPLWQEKNQVIGVPRPAGASPALDGWLSRQHLARCRAIFEQAGMAVL